MKTLVFSDTHLSNKVDPARFSLLKQAILDADQVIINGDFWDQYLTSFDKFVHSGWNELFPLLKQRHALYILGNHDMREHLDERWQLFADRLEDSASVHIGNYEFQIGHGHLQTFAFDQAYPRIAKLFLQCYPLFEWLEQKPTIFSYFYLEFLRKRHIENDLDLRAYSKQHMATNCWHVFSHSHTPRIDADTQYLNPGMFRCGTANWLTIDDLGKATLHSENY